MTKNTVPVQLLKLIARIILQIELFQFKPMHGARPPDVAKQTFIAT